jgi:hypothetical protein
MQVALAAGSGLHVSPTHTVANCHHWGAQWFSVSIPIQRGWNSWLIKKRLKLMSSRA